MTGIFRVIKDGKVSLIESPEEAYAVLDNWWNTCQRGNTVTIVCDLEP